MAKKMECRIPTLAEAAVRRARAKIAAYMRETKVTRKIAITLIGEIKACLDRAGEVYDPFNHFIGEEM